MHLAAAKTSGQLATTSRSAPSISSLMMSGRAVGIEARRLSSRCDGIPTPSVTWAAQELLFGVFSSSPRSCDHRAACTGLICSLVRAWRASISKLVQSGSTASTHTPGKRLAKYSDEKPTFAPASMMMGLIPLVCQFAATSRSIDRRQGSILYSSQPKICDSTNISLSRGRTSSLEPLTLTETTPGAPSMRRNRISPVFANPVAFIRPLR
jgi:hypothetical protein